MENEEKKIKFKDLSTGKKVWKIVSTTLVALFGVFAVVMLASSITLKVKGEDTFTFNNTQVRLVLTESMEWDNQDKDDVNVKHYEQIEKYEIGEIKKNDAVIINAAPDFPLDVNDENELAKYQSWHSELKVGDVVTFSYVTQGKSVPVTHRIIKAETYGNGYHFIMQGDNWGDAVPGVQHVYTATDKPDSFPLQKMIGKVTKVSEPIGGFMNFAKSKWAIAVFVIVPCAAIMIFEIVKIITIVSKDKKQKLIEQITAQAQQQVVVQNSEPENNPEDEIARLKRQLAEKEEQLKNMNKNEGEDNNQ